VTISKSTFGFATEALRGYLSDVERGARPAPLETTVRRLAHELNLQPEESETLVELAGHSRQAWKVRDLGVKLQ